MLQQSALAGVLFLVGVFGNSVPMATGGILGTLAGMAAGRLLRVPAADIAAGLYGFNGALVGMALPAFLAPGWAVFMLIVAGSALSSLLMATVRRWLGWLPAYTAPFVLSTWLMLAAAAALALPPALGDGLPLRPGWVAAVLRGLGQVMFQDSALAGLIFLAGLAVHSWRAAAWALAGSLCGLLCALLLGFPADLASAGLFGFNGALAGIALGLRPGSRLLLPLAGIVLSTLLLRAFQLAGLPALTAPFVLASWAVLALQFLWRRAGRGAG
ncbi:MAG: urea transporter [Gammaproteobacteria bacterium]|nr:urea transporter [Gammaproteobacteria bacterium]